ncbi:MAG: HIT domain-containing protein [Hyphomicrobiales bacterium]|nr:HIT domain-containing protein [Hyphomicrobiales bacterium]
MPEFILDRRLQADCLYLHKMELCDLLLMNDNRWPWLILVPRIVEAKEIHQMNNHDQILLLRETVLISSVLADISGCEKINTGSLGNIVRQLHVHVVGRSTGDANWPGPIWGYGKRQPYQREKQVHLMNGIRKRLA